MAHISGIYLALASICLALCNVAVAQTVTTTLASTAASTVEANSTTEAPVVQYSCENATAMTVNGTKLLGTWYEVARKPIGVYNNTYECIELVLNQTGSTVTSQFTYSNTPTSLWLNQTISNTLVNNGSYASDTFEGLFYVVSNGVNTTYKILDTDYSSYMLSCGYVPTEIAASTTSAPATTVATTTVTESTSNTTVSSNTTVPSSTEGSTTVEPVSISPAGAFIFTRERSVNSSVLSSLIVNAQAQYPDFDTVATIIQSSECYTGSAATTVPALAMILAVVYSLLKFVH